MKDDQILSSKGDLKSDIFELFHFVVHDILVISRYPFDNCKERENVDFGEDSKLKLVLVSMKYSFNSMAYFVY